MALFTTDGTGTSARDFFFGPGNDPDSVFDGGAGNDFILGDATGILVDNTTDNAAARVIDLTTLNAAFAAATNIDLAAFWTTQTNPTVDDDSVPHMTIYGTGTSTNDSEFFTVTVGAGETITLDLDFAYAGSSANSGTPGFDGQVRLFDMNSATPVNLDDDGPNIDPGSIGTGNGNGGNPRDSFFTYTNNTGAAVTYLIEVEELNTGQIETSDQYILNVSVTNHAIGTETLVTGNDTLTGGAGNDVLFGVGGNDTFVASDNDGNDYMDGGNGTDLASYNAVTGDLTIDLSVTTAQNTGAAGVDTFLNIERIGGGSGNDTFTAADSGSSLFGNAGDDTLTGRAGDDFFLGGTGRDTVIAGDGDDIVQLDRTNHLEASEIYNGGAGIDELRLFNSIDNTVFDFRTATTFANFEEIFFAAFGGEEIVVQLTQTQWAANAFATIISGNRSAEAVIEVFADSTVALDLSNLAFSSNWDETRDQVILQGDGQDNILIAAEVATVINGGDGADRIFSGAGDDTLDGGAGDDDTLSYANYDNGDSSGVFTSLGVSSVTNAATGTDQISGFENLVGSAFDDQLFIADGLADGGLGDDVLGIFGSNRRAVLNGDAGDDAFSLQIFSTLLVGSVFDGGADIDEIDIYGSTSGTLNLRNVAINSVERITFSEATDASYTLEFNASQFAFSDIEAEAHMGQTRTVSIFLNTETTLDLSGVTFTGFTEMGDGTLITGDADAEMITGSSINDTINAGDGDDVIIGGAGGDTIDGGAGTNTLSYEGSSVGVQINLSINQFNNGDAAGDSAANIQNLTGSDGNDSLVGTGDSNIIRGGLGDDSIHATGSSDVDQVFGGAGNDNFRIDAGELNDGEIYNGGADTDILRLVANAANQTFDFTNVTLLNFETLQISQAFSGGHELTFTSGQFQDFDAVNTTDLTSGDTSITVNMGTDNSQTLNLSNLTFDANWTAGNSLTINAVAGINTLTGSVVTETFNGGSGSDRFFIDLDAGGYETDTFNGGADMFNGTLGSGDVLVLGAGVTQESMGIFTAQNMTLTGVEEIVFNQFRVSEDGTALLDFDSVLQLAASQIGNGGIALDALITGVGDLGNPSLEITERIEITLDHEGELNLSGWQFLDWNEGVGTDRIVIIGNDIEETLTGTTEADEINGNGGDDILRGGAGEDTLNGGAGEDRLEGGTFSDTLLGGTNADILVGGSGNDFLDGGTNFDTALYTGLSTGVTVDLDITTAQNTIGAGTDTLIRIENLIGSGQGDTLSGNFNRNRLDGGAGSDVIDGRGGNDTLLGGTGNDDLMGGTGADRLVGGAGEDRLYGGDQRDRLEGGADDDELYGGADVDRLLGGDGDDTLQGGSGTDFLFGGAGADSFVFTGDSDSGVGPFQRDEIRDFNRAEGDQIVLQNFDADSTTAGFQIFSDGGDSFSGTAGEIIIQAFVRSGVDVRIVSLDTDGDAKADSQIYLISDDVQFSDITQLFGANGNSNKMSSNADDTEISVFETEQNDAFTVLLNDLNEDPSYSPYMQLNASGIEPDCYDLGDLLIDDAVMA